MSCYLAKLCEKLIRASPTCLKAFVSIEAMVDMFHPSHLRNCVESIRVSLSENKISYLKLIPFHFQKSLGKNRLSVPRRRDSIQHPYQNELESFTGRKK